MSRSGDSESGVHRGCCRHYAELTLMLPDGALFYENGVPIPVVIVADLRAMGEWLPPEAQRISGISCVGLALDGTSYLTRHSFEQIGERTPSVDDLSHPAWQWDEQAVQSTNQRMESLAINALLVQLYQPELLSTGPAARTASGKRFAAAEAPAAVHAGPIGAAGTATPCFTVRNASSGGCNGSSPSTWG